MNIKKRVVIFVVVLFYSVPVWAEKDSVRSKLVAQAMKIAVDSNNYISMRTSIEEYCGANEYFENRESITIYERHQKLDEILSCMKTAKAAAAASAISKNNLGAKLAAEETLKPAITEISEESNKNKSEVDFMGLNWGLGFGYSFSDDEAIDDAEIVNGVVRVSSNKKEQPRVVLEFHKYLWCNEGAKLGVRGCGPFISIAATQDDLLAGVGMGFMYGFKAKPSDSEGFSIGVGAILDADVKDLADGFKENKAAPSGETSVRYKSESRWSTLIFVTRTF